MSLQFYAGNLIWIFRKIKFIYTEFRAQMLKANVNGKKNMKPKVALLGFMEACKIPLAQDSDDHFDYIPITCEQTDINLSEFAGIMIPSGAFEEFKESHGFYGPSVDVYSRPALVNHWVREILVNHKKELWVCCLADKVIDQVPDGNLHQRNISKVDLIKQLLNSVGFYSRRIVAAEKPLDCKVDEFRQYFERYGIGNTLFSNFYHFKKNGDFKLICGDQDQGFSFVFNTKFFVFPFHPEGLKQKQLQHAVKLIGAGIYSFRMKNQFHLPDWLSTITFAEEFKQQKNFEDAVKNAQLASEKLEKFREYKGILTNSGSNLCKLFVEILRKEFGFSVVDEEKYVQDFSIIDDESKKIGAVCESKGVNGGVSRGHLAQVDSFRDRVGLPPNVPGLLFINDFMEIESLEARISKLVDPAHVKKAAADNIIIIRAAILLRLLLAIEEKPTDERRAFLWSFIKSGGGCLVIDDTSFQVSTT
jgi:hypothetical protein